MGRKKFTASAKQLAPDPRFGSLVVAKFINTFVTNGKKATVQRFFYDAMDIIEKKISDATPQEVFEKAIDNVKPLIEVRSKRVGGSNYQVPRPVNRKRQTMLAFRWIRESVRKGKGRPIRERMAKELMDAYKGEGSAMTTRENVHRMAEANKAFAHFAR